MKLEAVELRRIRLQLVAPFRTSFGSQVERDILLVHAFTDKGDGWGECVALAAPVYSSEYVDGAQHVLANHLLPRLFAEPDLTAERVGAALAPIAGHRMAKACIEMAVLDAQLRARRTSWAEHFGAVRSEVDCGVSVGIHDSIAALLRSVEAYLEQGYRRVKLKIEPGWDVGPVRAVRGRW